jgi:hypothetical protein
MWRSEAYEMVDETGIDIEGVKHPRQEDANNGWLR